MSDCPDLPATCDGLSQCCDRKYGTWLMAKRCGNTGFCDNSIFSRQSCICESYVRDPGALAAIIIGIVILLAGCWWWSSRKEKAQAQAQAQAQVQQVAQVPSYQANINRVT